MDTLTLKTIFLVGFLSIENGLLAFGLLGVFMCHFIYIGTPLFNEETMLLEQFGDQYRAYRQRTMRLVSFIF